jgi:hypothetical protein
MNVSPSKYLAMRTILSLKGGTEMGLFCLFLFHHVTQNNFLWKFNRHQKHISKRKPVKQ